MAQLRSCLVCGAGRWTTRRNTLVPFLLLLLDVVDADWVNLAHAA